MTPHKLFLCLLFSARIVFPQSVEEIVNKHIAALGGAERIAEVKSLKFTGTVSSDSVKVPIIMTIKGKDKIRMDLPVYGRDIIQALDGSAGWFINPSDPAKAWVQKMNADDIKEIKEHPEWEGQLVGWKEKGLAAAPGFMVSVSWAEYWYAGASLGTQFSANGDTKIPSIYSKPPLTSKPVYKTGYTINLNGGYKFHKLFRIEGELSYLNLPMKKIENAIGEGTETIVKNSDTELFSFFVNGHYDLRLSRRWMIHFGAGAGFIHVKNTIHPDPPVQVSENTFFTVKELNYNAPGYQGVAGIGYRLSRNMHLHLNYKYFSTFEATKTASTNLGQDSYETKQKVTSHVIIAGVSFMLAD